MVEKVYKNFWGEDTSKLWYKAPSDVIFNEMKTAFLQVWSKYAIEWLKNDTVETAKNLTNIRDNYTWFFTKCDWINQNEFIWLLKKEARKYILKRIYANELTGNMIEYCAVIYAEETIAKKVAKTMGR
jgi:hypothetical protein